MKQIALIITLIVIAGLGYFIYDSMEDTSENNDAKEDVTVVIEDETAMDAMEKPEEDAMEESDGMDLSIQSGSTASYTVNKGWLDKPSEEVTGVTQEVNGKIGFDAMEDGSYQLTAAAQITPNFDSGNGVRDGYVTGLFDGTIQVSLNETVSSDLATAGTYSQTVTLGVTINGQTQQLPAEIVIVSDGEALTISGSTNFTMSSFGIEPPSMVGLYNTADPMSIAFEIQAS